MRAAPREAGARDGNRDPQAGRGVLRPGERPPKMIYTFIADRCADLPVAACCRVMKVSTIGVLRVAAPPGQPDRGARRRRAGRTRRRDPRAVLRHLWRAAGARRAAARARPRGEPQTRRTADARSGRAGITRRRRSRAAPDHESTTALSDDLVNRQFRPDGPDRLWVQDVTEHRTGEGKVYLAVVLDAWSAAGSSAGRSPITSAPSSSPTPSQMATWRRRPPAGRRSPTPITGRNTRRGCSGNASAPPACSARWAPSATASTVSMIHGPVRCRRRHWAVPAGRGLTLAMTDRGVLAVDLSIAACRRQTTKPAGRMAVTE